MLKNGDFIARILFIWIIPFLSYFILLFIQPLQKTDHTICFLKPYA